MEQFDINEFARMFDAALASDNPAVQKALRNFMMIAAIVHAQELNETERLTGPFEGLLKEVGDLKRMVHELQNNRVTRDQYRDYYKDYIVNNPSWIYQQPTTSISTTNGTTWKDSVGYTAQDISDLLKDLRFNEQKSD